MIKTKSLYSEAKEALRFFVTHSMWKFYMAYEQDILSKLEREALRGNLTDPAYALKKAHAQGMVDALKLLQDGRNKLLKGDYYGNTPD